MFSAKRSTAITTVEFGSTDPTPTPVWTSEHCAPGNTKTILWGTPDGGMSIASRLAVFLGGAALKPPSLLKLL